ncbi:hypothetical protein BD626DRAFT_525166 [Schizophyllum amplum]|uniref:phytol kinase n=1 Tax=Schizophyllum amplum TaxID=97359 RepID=A0A550BSN4_9AGAR|nr:hypothetical protein BD626DRAFT_525166 [Auriculariopsis ampla]
MDEGFIRELEDEFASLILGPAAASPERAIASDPSSSAGGASASSNKNKKMPSRKNDPPMMKAMGASSLLSATQKEMAARKARKKDRKTICGRCGKDKLAGTKLQTCSRCKSINYCSESCQREHWQDGHKEECAAFVQPPLAKTFDPSDRPDVPWPVDPIHASTNENGLGIWMTTSGHMGSMLQQAFHPPEGYSSDCPLQGPPSFRRWAGLEGPNQREFGVEMKKYTGPSLVTLRIVVQNRRTDGRAIAVCAGETIMNVFGYLKNNLLPEDRPRVRFQNIQDGRELMMSMPWVDYNRRLRVAIVEVNGAVAPKGKFLPDDGEYEPPARPTGYPWNRVVDWERGQLVLGPGDYAVYCVQYPLGNGHEYACYPEIMTRTTAVAIPCYLTNVKNTEDGWFNAARMELRIVRALPGPGLPPGHFNPLAPVDFEYVEEYYRPYVDHGLDRFAVERYGKRAEKMNEFLLKTGPLQMQSMMSALPADQREEVMRRSKAMGFDMERMMRGG